VATLLEVGDHPKWVDSGPYQLRWVRCSGGPARKRKEEEAGYYGGLDVRLAGSTRKIL
jgi:hypothetical protein